MTDAPFIAPRPRRSVLYMPGASAKVLAKARSLPADCIIMDLEDAVAPDAKDMAREQVMAMVSEGGFGNREVIIRVNSLSTDWGRADVAAAANSGAHGLLFPKIGSGEEVHAASRAMDAAGAGPDVAMWAMIETPLAILSVGAIAAASRDTRLSAFVMGTNDLAKETGARLTQGRAPFYHALSASVIAARAYDLAVIDGVYNDIGDEAGFAMNCRQGVEFGFDGKTLIHPDQIAEANKAFAPTADEVAQARDVISAFDDPVNAGMGVLKVNGKMTELLHRDMARRTVAIADAIDALAG